MLQSPSENQTLPATLLWTSHVPVSPIHRWATWERSLVAITSWCSETHCCASNGYKCYKILILALGAAGWGHTWSWKQPCSNTMFHFNIIFYMSHQVKGFGSTNVHSLTPCLHLPILTHSSTHSNLALAPFTPVSSTFTQWTRLVLILFDGCLHCYCGFLLTSLNLLP